VVIDEIVKSGIPLQIAPSIPERSMERPSGKMVLSQAIRTCVCPIATFESYFPTSLDAWKIRKKRSWSES